MIMPPIRKSDKWGEGHYGASRGKRKHNGVDYACYPGSKVYPKSLGKVTKIGYPYSDDLSFLYVEVTTRGALIERYFYIEPSVILGDIVSRDDIIGTTQKLGNRYPGITEHYHYERFKLIEGKKEYINPIK